MLASSYDIDTLDDTDLIIGMNAAGDIKRFLATDFGSGSGTPGGSNTEIQFNDNGAFGGDPDLTFTADGLTNKRKLIVGNANANYLEIEGGAAGLPVTLTAVGSDSEIYIKLNPKGDAGFTQLGPDTFGVFDPSGWDGYNISLEILRLAATKANVYEYYLDTRAGDIHNSRVYGFQCNVSTQYGSVYGGSAVEDLDTLAGFNAAILCFLDAGTVVNSAYASSSSIYASGGATVTSATGVATSLSADTGSNLETAYGGYTLIGNTVSTNDYGKTYGWAVVYDVLDHALLNHATYAFHCNDISANVAVNPYYLWFDSPGVYRIKGDGIMAYYNPSFSPKYTAGATDFERVVQQWTSNVLEYGPEAGGTGTLREMRLIGARVNVNKILHLETTTNASPQNGDIWFDGTDFKKRKGGVTSNLET